MRTLVVLSLLTLAFACKGKPKGIKRRPPTCQRSTGSAGELPGVKPAPDIVLPKGDGSPPKKTTAQLDEATLTKLQAMTFPGFTLQPHGFNAKGGFAEQRQKTEDHPRIWATVTIKPCTATDVCTPMDVEQWKAKGDALKELIDAASSARCRTPSSRSAPPSSTTHR